MLSQARVLVVDDERFFREAIRDVLEPEGYDLVVVGDGVSALDEAADPTLGVAILDLQLPDLHGLEVFRRLREARPDLRVIILSAHTDQEYVLEALRLGACDYLAKPLHEEELCLAVRRAGETFALFRAREQLSEQVRRLDGLFAALVAPDPGAIAQTAADLLGATRASLLRVDPSGSELRVAAAVGAKPDADEMEPIALGQGIAGLLAERGEGALVADVSADERLRAWARPDRYQSGAFVAAPLHREGRLVGLLCAADPSRAPAFDEDDAALLGILAAHAAAGLEAPSEGAHGSGDGRLAALAQRICEALTAEVEPTRVLEAALRPVGELVGAAPAAIYLWAPDGKTLVREAQWDGGRASDRPRLEAPLGLTASVLDGGRLVASPDPSADARFEADADTPDDGVVRPLLCGPLRFRGKTLGVFRVFPERAEDARADIGEMLAASLSAAVRNVLLYRSLLETIEEVATARREGASRSP